MYIYDYLYDEYSNKFFSPYRQPLQRADRATGAGSTRNDAIEATSGVVRRQRGLRGSPTGVPGSAG